MPTMPARLDSLYGWTPLSQEDWGRAYIRMVNDTLATIAKINRYYDQRYKSMR